MADKVYYRGEGDENTFHNSEIERLRESEDAASDDFSEQEQRDYGSELANRRNAESNPSVSAIKSNSIAKQEGSSASQGFWRGQGRQDGQTTKKRKLGPAALILLSLFGVGGFAAVSFTSAPFALVSNALDQFNVMRTAMNRRSTYFMRFQMDETLNKSLTNRRFGIFSSEKFQISNSMKRKLAAQGIEYKTDDTNHVRYLVYTDPNSGEVTPVVANTKDLDKMNGVAVSNKDGKAATKSVMMLDDVLEADSGFFTAHQNATKTVKGHIVGWFESLTDAFLNRIDSLRNRFKGNTDETSEEEVKRKAKTGGLEEDIGDTEGNARTRDNDTDESGRHIVDYDDNGNPIYGGEGSTDTISGKDGLKSGDNIGEVREAVKTKVNKVSAAVGKLSSGQGIVCGIVNAVSALNLTISALNVAKVINFITGFLEAVQRTQIGEGGSEMMVYYNAFAEPQPTEVWEGDENTINKTVVSNKSTMASTAYNVTFGGVDVNPNDPEVAKFNRDTATKYAISNIFSENKSNWLSSLGDGVGDFIQGMSSLGIYQACLYSGMALAGVSAITDVVLLFATFGVGNLIKSFVKGAVQVIIQAAIATGIAILVSWIVPKLAEMLAMDLISNLGGEDSANAIRSGFNIYMGKSMEANSGGVGDEASVMAMYKQTQEIIAEDARYDRATRSPLDPTSKYTFVGSIVNSLIPVANMLSGNSLLSAIGSLVTSVGTSALSVLPSASAANETWYEVSLNHDCPNLSGFQLVGDAYCNPYYTTDFSTIDMDPYDVVENVGLDQFEDTEEDNPAIKDDSELATYIVACTMRDSQYGVKDTLVESWLESPTKDGVLDAVIDGGLGAIPIVGDLWSISQDTMTAVNLKWNTGQACVQNTEVNPDWSKYKYYQRYVEDQTLMEASGIIDKSQVTAFVERYIEDNPVDNSLEGVIARYSGMSKEEVSDTIALAEYITFLGSYNPSNLYPVPIPTDDKIIVISVLEPLVENEVVEIASVKHVVYTDLRSRNYTV